VFSRSGLRITFVIVLFVSAAVIAAASDGVSTASREDVPEAPPAENHTVVTESGRAGTITVYNPDGEVFYYNNSRTKYFDVDPVEDDSLTVEYVATDTIHTEGPTCSDPPCVLNVLERVDLETGEVEVLYERYDYKEVAGEWHDADRIDEKRVVIADIVADQVFVVNTETEIVEWLWDAQSDFPVQGGGPFPKDWAHINDVEYLEDAEGDLEGIIMVSLRNQDQVVFVDPEEGLLEEWTLGAEDDYDVQFEQHNPDFIPARNGGPAGLVADSENNRVVEFQWENDSWRQAWSWQDSQLQWPRDADRLRNGNTLIADSHGNRLLEISPDGSIAWLVPIGRPYDAERLGSGDESQRGYAAGSRPSCPGHLDCGGPPRGDHQLRTSNEMVLWMKAFFPPVIINSVLFIAPQWIQFTDLIFIGLLGSTLLVWGSIEWVWSDRSINDMLYRLIE
jgi:hypothetical protein